jgi:hypothetical protein
MKKSGYWHRLSAVVMTVLATFQANAGTTEVPESWTSYAQLVGQQFQAWIGSNGAEADSFYQSLDIRGAEGDSGAQGERTILVRVWIDPDGRVGRVVFDSLGNAQADAALRTLLTAHAIPGAPPQDMPQPIRIRLHIERNPDATSPNVLSGRTGNKQSGIVAG